MKPLFLWCKIGWCLSLLPSWKKGEVLKTRRMTNGLAFTFLVLHQRNEEKLHLSSPIQRKGSRITFPAETAQTETLLGPG